MSSASTSAELPQDHAQWLFTEGATIVFLDVPPGTEFGIDYNSWTVGDKFRGVKMIPPGVHFVYYSAVGRDRQVAPRTGFMHNFTRREVMIKKWDRVAEDVVADPSSVDERERIESNKQELDRYLGVYPYDSYKKWVSLTNHITPELLLRLQPLSGKISAVTPLQSLGSTTESRRTARAEATRLRDEQSLAAGRQCGTSSDASDESLLPDMKPIPGTEVRFTEIPRRKYPATATLSDVTRYNMDHSYLLRSIITSDTYAGNPLNILGELQFAFVCFLIGQVFDGFEQWKKLVDLLCSCVDAVADFPTLYTQFISTLHYHIDEIPQDFFVDIVTRENFLTQALRKFFENMKVSCETSCDASEGNVGTAIAVAVALRKRGDKFRAHLENRFNWDFGSELDEYAPVVVEGV